MKITFDYPWVLWALVFLLPPALFNFLKFGGKRSAMPPVLARRAAASVFFFYLFLISFIIALAVPRWGQGQAVGTMRRDVDVVIAMDVSHSMDIRDITDKARTDHSADAALSRLRRGASLALEAAAGLPEIRFGVAVGRSRSVLAVPLTQDSSAVINFLETLDSDSLTGRGTNLESLLDAASGAFQDFSPANRFILLVSDGESLSGSFRAAVERCRRNNTAIIAVALGGDTGQPVPDQEQYISSRNQKAMLMAADLSGGLYVDGNRGDALLAITGFLRSRAPVSVGAADFEIKSRWFLFIIIAIVCYGASGLCVLEIRKARFNE